MRVGNVWSRLRGTPPSKTAGSASGPSPSRRLFAAPSAVEERQLEPPSPWLEALVLGLWDNTCGPRMDQVWRGTAADSETRLDEELLSYAVRLTLASEIGGSQLTEREERLLCKLHVFGELQLVMVSVSFTVLSSEGPYKYALVLLCHTRHLQRYLELSDVVNDRIFRLAALICQLLERRLPAASHAEHLVRFMGHLGTPSPCSVMTSLLLTSISSLGN